jgi:hypothetical protein
MGAVRVGPEGLPWPEGDPGGLRAAASRAGGMASELDGQSAAFPGITGPLDWTGEARAGMSATATHQSAAVTRAAHAFSQAAHALTWLAGVVESAQHEVIDAAKKLHAAREAESRAIRTAATARAAADDLRRQADAVAGPPTVLSVLAESRASDAETTASGLETAAAGAVSHSQDVERWAMGLAKAAVERAHSGDGRVASELAGLDLIGGAGPNLPVAGTTSPSGLTLLVTPLLGTSGALESLGRLVFGAAAKDNSSLVTWLTAPPPLPPPPPPPKPQHHSSGGLWAAVGLTTLAVGADIFAGAQLGLDPLADAGAGAADTAAAGADTAAIAGDAAATDAAVTGAAATASEAVPVLTAEEADGAMVPLSEEEQATAQAWAKELPTKMTPVNDARGVYEVNQTGEANMLMKGGDQQIWSDGFRTEDGNALEAKYISKPGRSPFIEGSKAPDFIRQKALDDITSEVTRYGAVVTDPTTPVRALEVVTNDPDAAPVFARLMQDLGVPGRVVVRP